MCLGKTVRELEGSIDSRELSEWMAYDRLDLMPDPWREAGTVAATLANLLSGARYAFKPDDFIPRPRRVRILSSRAGLAWMKGVAAAVAARFKGGLPSPPSAGSRSD